MKLYTIREREKYPEVTLVETSNSFGDQILELFYDPNLCSEGRKLLGSSFCHEGSHYGEKTKILWAKRILKESGV